MLAIVSYKQRKYSERESEGERGEEGRGMAFIKSGRDSGLAKNKIAP